VMVYVCIGVVRRLQIGIIGSILV